VITMDLEKIRVRRDLGRMVINYFLMGKISEDQSNRITNYVDDVIGGGCLPEPSPEKKIICFPGAWQEEPTDPAEHPALYEEPRPPFAEHCEAFKGIDFGGNPAGDRILWALYHNRIHSIEDLARTPAAELLGYRRIGKKILERIRAALKSRGFALGDDWGVIAGARRHEG
jgi:hypothetical protein